MIGIFAINAQADCKAEVDIGIDDKVGNRRRGSVFVPHYFFGVEIVNPLFFSGLSAVLKTIPDIFERVNYAFAKASVKNTWFRGRVKGIMPLFGAQFHDFAVINNKRGLPLVYHDA